MRKLKCFLASSIVILFVGCSGKVQTNPLPDVRKYHFPGNSKEKELNTTLNEYGAYFSYVLPIVLAMNLYELFPLFFL